MTARPGGPRRLHLTFAAADRQIALSPSQDAVGVSSEPIPAPSLGSHFAAIGNRRARARMKGVIIFDLEGPLAESKTNLMRRPAAPNSRGMEEDLFPKISPSYKKIIGALNQAVCRVGWGNHTDLFW